MDTGKIRAEFYRIKGLGYLPNVKSDKNDGGAGNTFEAHLGVEENNKRDADFDNFEVKTKKLFLKSKSPITLFSKSPTFPKGGDDYMRQNWGVPDSNFPNVLCFRTSLFANRWSTVYGTSKIKVEVDRKSERVYLIKADLDGNVLDRTIYWSFDDIHSGAKKLENLFLVDAMVEEINGKVHFKYVNATAYLDYVGNTDFIELLEQGVIQYDNRLGVHGADTKHAGKPHNHGGGFRIHKKNVEQLYRVVVDI